jgi:hypothetical protein
MNEEIKVESIYLAGKHICESLGKTNPMILTIDENDRLIIVSHSIIQGSNMIWFKIEYCPFCGVKL